MNLLNFRKMHQKQFRGQPHDVRIEKANEESSGQERRAKKRIGTNKSQRRVGAAGRRAEAKETAKKKRGRAVERRKGILE